LNTDSFRRTDVTELAIRPSDQQQGPQELYRHATDVAGVCREIVLKTVNTIQGKRYVKIEGWQAIATAHGCMLSVEEVSEDADGNVSAIASVRRMSDGTIIAKAEGYVGMDERTWSSRTRHARRAMAQTRAMSRAARSGFAHVVVLIDAGLCTTPAEEMGSDDAPEPVQPRQAPPRPQPAQQHTQQAEVKLASEMQVREVKTLLPLAKLPTALVDEWFRRAGVDLWEKMPADTIGKCITYLREKIEQQRAKEPEPPAAKPAPPPISTTDDEWEAFSNALVENAERAGEVDRVTAVLTVLKKRNLNPDQLSEVLSAMEKSEFDWQTSQITTSQAA
jgi:hypothetical protein